MRFDELGAKDKERFLKELSTTLVWFGANTAVTEEFSDKTFFHTLLLFPPKILEKLAEDPSFEPQELQQMINTIFFKFTSSLSACLLPAVRGESMRLKTIIEFSDLMDYVWRAMLSNAEAYESHLKAEKGEQDLPFFLRYDRTLVEGRFFDAISEASLSGEVLPTKRVNELLAGCSPREMEVLKEKLEEINDLVAELRLREASKDDIMNQLSDLFDDFFTQTEP